MTREKIIKIDYRVIKSKWRLEKLKGEEYSIREVYYNKIGNPTAWSKEPSYLCCETFKELVDDMERMKEAFKKPILREIVSKGKEKLIEIK